MEDLEEKLQSMLSDPELMQKVSTMAQSLGLGNEAPVSKTSAPMPNLDPATLAKFSSIFSQGNIDHHQQSLLHALTPYLSSQRISRLEKAMRAAAMAKVATSLWGKSGTL